MHCFQFMRYLPLLVLSWTVLLFSCENDIAEIEALSANLNTEVETAKDVEILYSDSAQVRVKIAGPTMLYHLDKRDPRQEFIDGVKVDFFDAEGTVTSKLTAKYAIRLENKNEVIVRDSVVWQSIEKEKIETEELIWQENKERIYTDRFVVITRPDEIVYGHGLEASQDFSYSRINAIQGRIKVDNQDEPPAPNPTQQPQPQ